MDLEKMITLAEYAKRVGKNPANIRQKILRGQFPEATKVGRDWLVPADAPYEDKRVKSGKYKDWRKEKE